ncbi:hypothetical protein EIP86_000973 [Pleurotus ostreatoroseus]|nr:hypothetical protein EIP86_000973 [Pleurotus ostreatoroseus]
MIVFGGGVKAAAKNESNPTDATASAKLNAVNSCPELAIEPDPAKEGDTPALGVRGVNRIVQKPEPNHCYRRGWLVARGNGYEERSEQTHGK